MTSPRGSNGGGEARWSGLVALPDFGSRVLSASAAEESVRAELTARDADR